MVSMRIFMPPAGFVESRSPNLKKRVPVASTIFCVGVYVGWSIPHSYLDRRRTQVIHGNRVANFAPQRISFVLLLLEEVHTSEISRGDRIFPARTSSPKSQSSKSS